MICFMCIFMSLFLFRERQTHESLLLPPASAVPFPRLSWNTNANTHLLILKHKVLFVHHSVPLCTPILILCVWVGNVTFPVVAKRLSLGVVTVCECAPVLASSDTLPGPRGRGRRAWCLRGPGATRPRPRFTWRLALWGLSCPLGHVMLLAMS